LSWKVFERREIVDELNGIKTAKSVKRILGLAHPQFFMLVGVRVEEFGSSGSAGPYPSMKLLPIFRRQRPESRFLQAEKRAKACFRFNPPRTGPIQWKNHRLRMMIQIPPP
jgi:hypothetical protein